MYTLEYAQECSLRGMLMKQLTNVCWQAWPWNRGIISTLRIPDVRKSETRRDYLSYKDLLLFRTLIP